jgi:hypothetical protein
VLQPAAGEQHVRLDQRLDDRFVGLALLALVGDDLLTLEARRIRREAAIGTDGERDGGVDAARFQVAGALSIQMSKSSRPCPGGGVHEAGTGVVGHVVAVEQRHVELVAAGESAQRMRRHAASSDPDGLTCAQVA